MYEVRTVAMILKQIMHREVFYERYSKNFRRRAQWLFSFQFNAMLRTKTIHSKQLFGVSMQLRNISAEDAL